MNGRGEYGVRPNGMSERGRYGVTRVGIETRRVPVIDVDVERVPQVPLLTTRVAIWDPAAERIAGGSPSYYTERDGGWWYFAHPEGEAWFAGRRFRLIKPRSDVTVLQADPSLRVSGVQIAKVFSSRSDFEQGLNQLDTDFNTLINEAITIMGGDPKVFTHTFAQQAFADPKLMAQMQKSIATIEKSKFYPYYKQVLTPLYNEWNAFAADPVSITEALTESALSGPFGAVGPSVSSKLKRWQERLTAARADMSAELAKLGKEPLRSPGSVPLPSTWFEKGEKAAERAGAGLEDIGKVLKYVLIGVAAVGGVVVVSHLAGSLKKGKAEGGPSYIERFQEPRTRALKVLEAGTPKARLEPKAPVLALPAAATS